jgi:alkanesulfonate monooxygenase SsuD/methylene tetrahydromethanopterin reductase-like flavin-dependent oxidoreductase (luciferase family)
VLNETDQRKTLTSSPQQIRDDLNQYQDAGLDYLVLSIDQPTEDDTAQAAFNFAKLANL